MKKIFSVRNLQKIGAFCLAFLIFSAPVILFGADEELIKGDEDPDFYTWSEFLDMLQRLASLMIKLAVAFAAAMFMWAGWNYVTAAGDESKIKRAHTIFKNVGIGVALAVGAFLIVATIVKSVGGEDSVKDWIEVE